MKILGKVCVNCTAVAIGLISLITLTTLIWTSMV
jgi:hypothetical protein